MYLYLQIFICNAVSRLGKEPLSGHHHPKVIRSPKTKTLPPIFAVWRLVTRSRRIPGFILFSNQLTLLCIIFFMISQFSDILFISWLLAFKSACYGFKRCSSSPFHNLLNTYHWKKLLRQSINELWSSWGKNAYGRIYIYELFVWFGDA